MKPLAIIPSNPLTMSLSLVHNGKKYRLTGDNSEMESTVKIAIENGTLELLPEEKETEEARPQQIREVIVPEFDAFVYIPETPSDSEWMCYPQTPGERNLWKQVAIITQWIHSQINKQ